jgi:hypothetical protein
MTGAEMRGSYKEEKRGVYPGCQIAPRSIAIREENLLMYPGPDNRPRNIAIREVKRDVYPDTMDP